jgi:predicted membrane protein
MSEHRSQGRIFWGLLLVVLGVLFLLDRTHTLDFGDLVARFWPVVFILIGVSILLSNNFRNAGSGIFFILFGTFFLLLRLRIFDQAVWRYLWPLAIIAVGLWILLRPAWHPDKKKIPEMTGDAGDDLEINQVFSGTARRVESQNFRGGKADVVFGSAEIDLRGARLSGGQATLTASVVFGGLTVFVPRDWQVLLQGTPVLGSIEAHRAAANAGVPTGVLTIRGSAVFGSIDIKE